MGKYDNERRRKLFEELAAQGKIDPYSWEQERRSRRRIHTKGESKRRTQKKEDSKCCMDRLVLPDTFVPCADCTKITPGRLDKSAQVG